MENDLILLRETSETGKSCTISSESGGEFVCLLYAVHRSFCSGMGVFESMKYD